MNIDELVFFDNRPNEFKIYETILDRLSRFGYEYSIRVQKTQISGSLSSQLNNLFYYVIIKWVNDMELNELLKELDTNLVIRKIEKSDKTLYLYCDIDCMIVKCKYCGTESHSVHSKYTRTISDLPIQNYQVKLIITVPKFFCTNEKCSHKTFAYPIPFADKNSLRTNRLDDYIYQIGMKSSSLDAEKQISGSHVSVSNNTILRIIKKKQSLSSIMR